jgi:hypothetical protein
MKIITITRDHRESYSDIKDQMDNAYAVLKGSEITEFEEAIDDMYVTFLSDSDAILDVDGLDLHEALGQVVWGGVEVEGVSFVTEEYIEVITIEGITLQEVIDSVGE